MQQRRHLTSVSEIKEKLKEAGFFHGPIDEEVTKHFIGAVIDLQKQSGQFADGLFGPATEQALERLLRQPAQR